MKLLTETQHAELLANGSVGDGVVVLDRDLHTMPVASKKLMNTAALW
jgi:hypothetical protein